MRHAVDQNCSRQFPITLEKFWYGTGARGSITVPGKPKVEGWVLFDTGATYTRLRHPTLQTGSDGTEVTKAAIVFGEWRSDEDLRLSPELWEKIAPSYVGDAIGSKGNQIATIGSELMKNFAVRIDDDKMYISKLDRACSAEKLIADGYTRLDTSGFYQLAGQSGDGIWNDWCTDNPHCLGGNIGRPRSGSDRHRLSGQI